MTDPNRNIHNMSKDTSIAAILKNHDNIINRIISARALANAKNENIFSVGEQRHTFLMRFPAGWEIGSYPELCF